MNEEPKTFSLFFSHPLKVEPKLQNQRVIFLCFSFLYFSIGKLTSEINL